MAALPKAEQYEKIRAALLTVAHELFAKQGYAGTSTQDIVERADVTRGRGEVALPSYRIFS